MRNKKNNIRYKDNKIAYMFIAPFIIMFVFFKFYPMIYGFLVSFLNRNSVQRLNDTTFVGLSNYIKILSSKTFWISFANTMIFSLVYTAALMIFSMFLAILFNKEFKGRVIVRTFFYMPYVTNIIAVGIVWKYLLNPTKGPVNAIFRLLNMPVVPQWLNSPNLALVVTALIGVWVALAFNIITFLAALQEIPPYHIEVADLEGATFFQKVKEIIIPHLMPTFFLLLVITIINSFRNYSIIISLTNGGPGVATKVLALQIYDDAFTYMKFSLAAAEGVIFTAFIIFINGVVQRIRNRWINQ